MSGGVSAALFVIPHLANMSGASAGIILFETVDLVLILLSFSFLTLRFESIWAACGLHSIWDFILYNILGFNLSGKDEMTAAVFDMRSVGSNILNEGKYGIEASVMNKKPLKKKQPQNAENRTFWGRIKLEGLNKKDAAYLLFCLAVLRVATRIRLISRQSLISESPSASVMYSDITRSRSQYSVSAVSFSDI